MQSSPTPEPVAPELLAALEREVQERRTEQAELERERAAIVLERAAIDAERLTWQQERHQLVEECQHLELERAQERATREQAIVAAEQDRLAYERAFEHERRELTERLERALRWSPRHWLGRLAHRSEAIRRLRSGR